MIPMTWETWGASKNQKACLMRRVEDTRSSNYSRVFDLHAIVGTWYESDIIVACVLNCFRNGCNSVHIVDNASPDDTCARAKAAGAEIAQVYETTVYDEAERLRRMNDVGRSLVHGADRETWLLFLDADEFPMGLPLKLDEFSETTPYQTVRSDIAFNGNCDAIGYMAFEHVPKHIPGLLSYVEELHPVSCQDYGFLRTRASSSGNPWKLCCVRYMPGDGFKYSATRGMHGLYSDTGDEVVFDSQYRMLHHCPLRNKEFMQQRLHALCSGGANRRCRKDDADIDGQGAYRRWENLNAIYEGNWYAVKHIPHDQCLENKRVVPKPWWELLDYHSYMPPLWY